MHIVYPLLWFSPGRQACAEQTINTVAALARRGHQLTLLMPAKREHPSFSAADLRAYFDVEGDFQVVPRTVRSAGTSLLPSLRWLRHVFADPEVRGADLLYSRIPAMFAVGGAAPIPFATDHYRPWPDDLPPIRPLIRRTARHPNCLGMVLHSDYAAQSYRRAGIAEEQILVAHNGIEPRRMGAAMDKAAARSSLGLPMDRSLAVYAGRINNEKGLDEILGLADRRPEILFLLIGSEGNGAVEEQARKRQNVRILPWAEPAALPAWLYAADVLLVPPSRAPLDRFRNCVLPMKIFTYLGAGRPILAPVSPDTAELLTHEDTAFLVPPGQPELAAAALDRLLGDAELAERLGMNARRLSGQLTWDRRAEKIADFLKTRLLNLSV